MLGTQEMEQCVKLLHLPASYFVAGKPFWVAHWIEEIFVDLLPKCPVGKMCVFRNIIFEEIWSGNTLKEQYICKMQTLSMVIVSFLDIHCISVRYFVSFKKKLFSGNTGLGLFNLCHTFS